MPGLISDNRNGSFNLCGERKRKPRNLTFVVSRRFTKLSASILMSQNGAGALLICVLGSTLSGYSATAVVCPPRQ